MDIDTMLAKFSQAKRQSDGSFMVICPAHADRNPSLHISQRDDKLLLKCHSGCSTLAICDALNIQISDLYIGEKTVAEVKERKIVATYTYQDEAGAELFQVVRFDPKSFSQRHQNGQGEYVWNLDNVRRVLYHLPEIIKSDRVFVCEGEKDADNLRKYGITATTSPGGANNWRAEYAQSLRGKQVIIIPDKDDAGYAYARQVAQSLKGIASSVQSILLPGDNKDFSDWIKDNDIEELPRLVTGVDVLEQTFTFENKSTRYIFKWGDIEAEVSRLRNTKGTTSCQIVFTVGGNHLLRTKFNLESSRVRSELAKELISRHKGIDWKKYLEDLSNRTLDEFEKGEPVIMLSSQDEVAPLEYLLDPIIPLGKPSVLFGDPGSGKTQLMQIMVILVSLPWVDNPLRLGVTQRPIVPLILDYEGHEDDIRRQLRSFTQGMDLGYVQCLYRRCTLPLADDIEAIRDHIDTIGANLVFVDSISVAAGGDLDGRTATTYFRSLRMLRDITTISLAHTSKERESKVKTILGSVLFEAGARSIIEVRGHEDEENDILDLALFHRKFNLSKKAKPMGFRITYTSDPLDPAHTLPNTISWQDPAAVAEFVERMGTNQRIIKLLERDGPLTDTSIAETLDITLGNCRVNLTRLKSKNIITKIDDKWALCSRLEK